MTIELVPLCEIDLTLAEPIIISDGPLGTRLIYEVTAGTVTGDRLRGSLHGSASADWALLHGTVGAVDVRATFVTDDGAVVLASYQGRVDLAGDGRVRVAPTFETGDARYGWLNALQAVGVGVLDGNRLHYDWYEVR